MNEVSNDHWFAAGEDEILREEDGCFDVTATPQNDLLRGDLCFSRCAANSPGKEDSELVIRFPLRRCKIKGSETFRLSSFTFYLLARTKYASSESKWKKKERKNKTETYSVSFNSRCSTLAPLPLQENEKKNHWNQTPRQCVNYPEIWALCNFQGRFYLGTML